MRLTTADHLQQANWRTSRSSFWRSCQHHGKQTVVQQRMHCKRVGRPTSSERSLTCRGLPWQRMQVRRHLPPPPATQSIMSTPGVTSLNPCCRCAGDSVHQRRQSVVDAMLEQLRVRSLIADPPCHRAPFLRCSVGPGTATVPAPSHRVRCHVRTRRRGWRTAFSATASLRCRLSARCRPARRRHGGS